MTKRVAIYARYSSELQSERSIEDQLALCRQTAEREGWQVSNTFTDYALSGASLARPGLQGLMGDARAGAFDLLLTESLDRLSRDQEDIAGLYKRLSAWQVEIITLSEGPINELHVGLKGTMNALFLKDLAAKSLRGQIGKAREGLAAGGIPYGYEVVRKIGDDGDLIRGHRRIVEEHADVVRRIFREFAAGRSSRAIAKGLNADGILSPRGGQWNPSTIQGHRGRGVGMLSNPIYVGQQVFNKHAFVRDPDTGTRRARAKDQDEWVEAEVPELAIVDTETWDAVQTRLVSKPHTRLHQNRRPKRVFSGLIKCGVCGGNLTIAYRQRYGCASARQKGTCTNNRTMPAIEIEDRVLGGLQGKLMEPELVQTFVDEYHAELQRLQKDARRRHTAHVKEKANLEQKIARLVDAIAEGTASDLGAVGNKLRELEGRLSDLAVFNDEEPKKIEWHPNAPQLYKEKIANLSEALHAEPMVRDEASAALRELVDRIVAYPAQKRGKFELELHGQLAAAMNLAMHDNVGGGRGIRTLETVTRLHAFQACAFSHSATPPTPGLHSRSAPCWQPFWRTVRQRGAL